MTINKHVILATHSFPWSQKVRLLTVLKTELETGLATAVPLEQHDNLSVAL